ncbi:hypothetical protein [Desulfovibrio sp.]|uniref:hypothetical protein n=1 Tax=Desulfovibrio sp. TaxID=885 RepID=UPI0023C420AE|nr:hypothetical protein [Desulfovibrio sp.]MDE7240400.1 hypothetical protein [Desulfovibrio sp.]
MRVLLGCVNSSVSLVGYDLAKRVPFWYSPGNVLRACGVCAHQDALWVATDNVVQRLDAAGVTPLGLPGPHENLAHSVKPLDFAGGEALGVADTGNSRVIVLGGGKALFSLSPLEGWLEAAGEGGDALRSLPPDAIHLNDFITWKDGLLVSAFNYQPFAGLKRDFPSWQAEGLGCLFHLRRHEGRTIARVAASGLDCPHSLTQWEGAVYCCSSARGMFFRYVEDGCGTLREDARWAVTESHFLRGALRVDGGWLLGGSSHRHQEDGGGMCLFLLHDGGQVEELPLGGPGEIYDIIPWDHALMPGICAMLARRSLLDLPGEFPPRCALPPEYAD